jgi:hypothetical protein
MRFLGVWSVPRAGQNSRRLRPPAIKSEPAPSSRSATDVDVALREPVSRTSEAFTQPAFSDTWFYRRGAPSFLSSQAARRREDNEARLRCALTGAPVDVASSAKAQRKDKSAMEFVHCVFRDRGATRSAKKDYAKRRPFARFASVTSMRTGERT